MDGLKEYELASIKRRFGALVIDYLIIFLIWYVVTIKDLSKVNDLMNILDPEVPGSLDILVEAIFKLYVSFIFKWIAVSTVMYTFFPAIFGNGKTLGKLLFGISVISDVDLNEISPSKLILREFVLRNIVESLLVIPTIISIFMVIFRKDSKSIHDLLSHTIVVRSAYSSTY